MDQNEEDEKDEHEDADEELLAIGLLRSLAESFCLLLFDPFRTFLAQSTALPKEAWQPLRPEGFAYAITYACLTRSLRAESLIFCILVLSNWPLLCRYLLTLS